MPSRNPNSPGYDPHPEIIELLRALPAAIAAEMSRVLPASVPPSGGGGAGGGGTGGGGSPGSAPDAGPSSARGFADLALSAAHTVGGPFGRAAGKIRHALRFADQMKQMAAKLDAWRGRPAQEPGGEGGPSEWEKAEQWTQQQLDEAFGPPAAEAATPEAEPPPPPAVMPATTPPVAEPPAGPQIPPGASPYEAELIRQGQPYRMVGATEPVERPTLQEALEAEGQPYRVGPAAVPEYGRPVEGASTDIPGAQVVEIPPKEDADFAPPPAEEFRGQGHVNPAWQGEEGAGIEAAAVPEGGVGLAGMEGGAEGGAENKMDAAADKLSDVADKLSDVADQIASAIGNAVQPSGGHGGGAVPGGKAEEAEGLESMDGLGEQLTAGGGAEAIAAAV